MTASASAAGPGAASVRVVLPAHLQTLAQHAGEVRLDVSAPVTLGAVLDGLEATYPVLRGTVRDHTSKRRRPFVRYFADEQDISHEPPDAVLPAAVAAGEQPLRIVGAMAGG